VGSPDAGNAAANKGDGFAAYSSLSAMMNRPQALGSLGTSAAVMPNAVPPPPPPPYPPAGSKLSSAPIVAHQEEIERRSRNSAESSGSAGVAVTGAASGKGITGRNVAAFAQKVKRAAEEGERHGSPGANPHEVRLAQSQAGLHLPAKPGSGSKRSSPTSTPPGSRSASVRGARDRAAGGGGGGGEPITISMPSSTSPIVARRKTALPAAPAREMTVSETLSSVFQYYSRFGARDSDGQELRSSQFFKLVSGVCSLFHESY
jgi:hypothetical protein